MNLVVSSCGLCCSPGQTLETEHLEAEQTFPTMSCTFPTRPHRSMSGSMPEYGALQSGFRQS